MSIYDRRMFLYRARQAPPVFYSIIFNADRGKSGFSSALSSGVGFNFINPRLSGTGPAVAEDPDPARALRPFLGKRLLPHPPGRAAGGTPSGAGRVDRDRHRRAGGHGNRPGLTAGGSFPAGFPRKERRDGRNALILNTHMV